MSTRFAKTSVDDWYSGCKFTGYRIDYVREKNSPVKIPPANYSSLFNLNPNTAVFTMTEFNKTYGPYEIYISASNGHTWSDPRTEGWAIEVTFVNSTPTLPNLPPYIWPKPTMLRVNSTSIWNKNESERYVTY